MKKFNVAIARFPRNGWEHTDCVEWLIKLVGQMKADDRIDEVLSLRPPGKTPITMLRNKAVVLAKQHKADFLLMLDSDMAPDGAAEKPFWDVAWEFMLARQSALAEVPLPPATIAAPYCGPPPHESPFVFKLTNKQSDHPDPDYQMEMVPRVMAATMAGIQPVDALPTGLILFDMRVFDMLKPPWFRYEFRDATESEKVTTEDVFVTRNANFLGLPLYCAFDSWAVHHQDKAVGKPRITTRDQVHESLREAVLRGVDSGDKLITLGTDYRVATNGIDLPAGDPHKLSRSSRIQCPNRDDLPEGYSWKESCVLQIGRKAQLDDGRCEGCGCTIFPSIKEIMADDDSRI